MIVAPTLVERERSFLVGVPAVVLEEDRLQAWAERYVRKDADIKWILGNFVEADRANDNGHIFPFDDLKDYSLPTIANKPLNMLHHGNYIVGAYAGAELLQPDGLADADAEVAHIEALSAFWRNFFPEEYALVEAAHKEGSLYYSMECIPQTLTCPLDDCKVTAAYQGRQHDSYCAHMNAPRGPKILGKPHFNAGALIIPPVRPGWRGADVKELSALMSSNADMAEKVYAGLEADMPHLDAKTWEAMMQEIVADAAADPTLPIPELVTPRRPKARTIAAGQIDKAKANYRKAGTGEDPDAATDPDGDDATDPDSCFGCRNGVFVMDGDGNVTGSMCELVSGPIDKGDVCDLYSESPTDVVIERWATFKRPSDALEEIAVREYARKFTTEQRKKMAKEGKAKPDGSFPIENEEDLKNAIKLAKAGDRAHVKKRAAALGLSKLIPDSWM